MTTDELTVTGTHQISHVRALEILGSRNCPTLQVTVTLADGIAAHCGVPSGSSIGSGEAAECRDHDLHRYRGLGLAARWRRYGGRSLTGSAARSGAA
jgi:enolase